MDNFAFPLPEDLKPKVSIPTTLLADDKILSQFEIHPGDELNVIGYPLGAASPVADFPVLRSGKIASYPLVPTSDNPFFLLDFHIFQGNSGGLVYFVQSNRTYSSMMHVETIQFVVGLVSEEMVFTQQSQELYEMHSKNYPLGLAKIVPASFIVETLKLLPPLPVLHN